MRTLEIQCIGSVISAEKFKKESQEGIKHNIKAERRAFGVLEAGVPSPVGWPNASPFIKLAILPTDWPRMMAGVTISANGRIGIFFFFKKKYAATQAKMTPPCIAMPPCQT